MGRRMHKNFDGGRLLDHYEAMVLIRAFEESGLEAQKQGLVLGAIHPSIGQEAVPVGVCAHLRGEDVLLSTHRGHGHTLAKGADPTAMMCELFGRVGGTCGGKGGSMHIADFAVGMLGANGVVAANIEIATGAAHAIRLKGEDKVVACFFGDGAINRGPFLEGLNWASVHALPILFVCEDNGFAATTRTAALTAGDGPLARARSLGIEAHDADGNDVVRIDELAGEMIPAIRDGGGPRFLLARTYRLTGHTAADPGTYRPPEEVEARWRDDPIARARTALGEAGIAGSEIEARERRARATIAGAFERARDAAWPEPALAFTDVQDLGAPEVRVRG